MMSVIAIITARNGSKGIPGKNIMNFCGHPLIAWSIMQAKKSKCIDEIYVTTDGLEIAEIAEDYGAKVIARPNELATDTATTESAMLHVLSVMPMPDAIVYLQPTSPLRLDTDIDNAFNLFINKKSDSLFSASILDDFCAWEEVHSGYYNSVTFDYKNRGRRQERKKYYLENGSVYIFKPYILEKYNNRLGDYMSIYEMPLWQSYEIDEPEDIEICEYFMKSRVIS